MKTLLINPDTLTTYKIGGKCAFPLGLGYIAAVLEKDHDVKIIDAGAERLDDDSLMKKISQISPKIVGITSDTLSFKRAIEIGKNIKRINEETIIVIGGAHSNALPAYPLKYDCFDISVYGEGERTVVKLWKRIEDGEDYHKIKGIAYKKNSKIVVNPKRELIKNLNELPFPARHLFPMEKYNGESHLSVSPVYSICTSRGCPFSCSFCSNSVVFGRTYRHRNTQNVVDEIELLINEYNAKGIYFREDIFTINKKRIIDICNEIKGRKLDFKWECESRVNTVDEEILRSMKSAGCEFTWFGVESGCQKTLDHLNKQITISQSRKAFELCKKIKIRTGASFLIGTPGEKIEDIFKTIEFAKEIKPDYAWFCIFTGYPTSLLYNYVLQNGLYEKDIGHGILVIKTPEFDREKLDEIQLYANNTVNWTYKKLFSRALFEIKCGKITKNKIVKSIKYITKYNYR